MSTLKNGKPPEDVIMKHLHAKFLTYPALAAGVLLTKGAGAWSAYPANKTEIIPVNTITNPFMLPFVSVDTISANGEYMVALYKGLAGAEELIAEVPAVRSAAASQEESIPTSTKKLPANTRISAALSSSNAAANTLNIKLGYYEEN